MNFWIIFGKTDSTELLHFLVKCALWDYLNSSTEILLVSKKSTVYALKNSWYAVCFSKKCKAS